MDKTFGLNAGKSGVPIPGRGKCSLITIKIYARVKYLLYLELDTLSPLRMDNFVCSGTMVRLNNRAMIGI